MFTMIFPLFLTKKRTSYVFKGPFVYDKKLQQIEKIEKTMEFNKNYAYAGFDEGFFAFIWMPENDSKPYTDNLENRKQYSRHETFYG